MTGDIEGLTRDVAYRMRSRIDEFQVEQKVIDVLCRLPADVCEFALEHCYFVAIGDGLGGFYISRATLLAEQPDGSWLVVLNSSWKGHDFFSSVAHEIAHLWLKHPEFDMGPDVDSHENAAAARVREWGFTGIGSEPFEDRP